MECGKDVSYLDAKEPACHSLAPANLGALCIHLAHSAITYALAGKNAPLNAVLGARSLLFSVVCSLNAIPFNGQSDSLAWAIKKLPMADHRELCTFGSTQAYRLKAFEPPEVCFAVAELRFDSTSNSSPKNLVVPSATSRESDSSQERKARNTCVPRLFATPVTWKVID